MSRAGMTLGPSEANLWLTARVVNTVDRCHSKRREDLTLNRLPRTALAILAGLVLVSAGACTSNSANSGTKVDANDPNSIIAGAVSDGSQIKSFHIKIAATGTIKSTALAGSSAAGALAGDLKLDGATIEGDVDIKNAAAHLTMALPAFPVSEGMAVPMSGEVIVVDKAAYYKFGLTGATGAKFTKQDLGSITSLASSLPVSAPSAGASAMTASSLQSEMAKAGVTSKVVGVEQVSGQDAYHITFTLPLDKINALAAGAGSASMKIDSLSLDAWIYKNGNKPAKAEVKVGSAAVGSVGLTVTITDYDKSFSVTAPAAGDVNP